MFFCFRRSSLDRGTQIGNGIPYRLHPFRCDLASVTRRRHIACRRFATSAGGIGGGGGIGRGQQGIAIDPRPGRIPGDIAEGERSAVFHHSGGDIGWVVAVQTGVLAGIADGVGLPVIIEIGGDRDHILRQIFGGERPAAA